MKPAAAADIVPAQPRESIEYVGGLRNGETEKRFDLPSEIPTPDGVYSRSARCVDDGATSGVPVVGEKSSEEAEMARLESEPRRLVSQRWRD
jgi:hypothetical protein